MEMEMPLTLQGWSTLAALHVQRCCARQSRNARQQPSCSDGPFVCIKWMEVDMSSQPRVHLDAPSTARSVRGSLHHQRQCFPQCAIRLLAALLVLQLSCVAVSAAADQCSEVGFEQPNVTTIYRSLTHDTEAIVLHPNCSFERVPISRDVDDPMNPAKVLNFTGMGVQRVQDYPSGIHTFVLDTNKVRQADFSNDKDIRHLILCWSQLTDIDKFVMPPVMKYLDLEGNNMRFLNGSKIPTTTTLLFLGENRLRSLDNFDFPRSLLNLHLHMNAITTLHIVTFPPQLRQLNLNANPITDLDSVALPDSLDTLSCTDCGIKSIVGFRLPTQLQNLDLAGSQVDQFELRKSDLDIFRGLTHRSITSRQAEPCSDPEATFQLVDDIPICVISNSRFDEKFPMENLRTSKTSASRPHESDSGDKPSSTNQKSPGVTTAVVGAVAVILATCGLILALVWYRRRRKHPSKAELLLDDDVTATEPNQVNGSRGALELQQLDREYLKDDVRIDEEMLFHRLPHQEVHIVREIANGGYGVVYLAQYQGDQVVLKRVLQDKSRDKVIVQRFMDEIRMCARLKHPKIVEFIGIVWTTLADLGVVIEYMNRGDLCTLLLSQQVKDGSSWFNASDHLPAKRSLALNVAEALVYLHSFEYPIIHRDLKSRNVLLNEDGTAKLSDFGISREQALDETMTAEVGTVAWIAPEVLQGERYGESADIYSFGIFMAELDKCSHPYEDSVTSTSDEACPTNICLAMLVSAGLIRPKMSDNCPLGVQELATRCLSQDPAQRPSAVELHYALCRL